MQLVSKHIKSLLFTNECVVIPDFGGLVSNPNTATYNKLNGYFSAPYKAIGFNIRLKKNDGLLIQEISIQENIDYKEAAFEVSDFVAKVNDSLINLGRFELEEIGIFYFDVNKNLRFKQNRELSADPSFFGLSKFRYEIEQQEATPKKESSNSKREQITPVISITEHEESNKEIFAWKKLAIAACITPFMFYLFWIGYNASTFTDSNQFQYSDLNPFQKKICAQFIPRKNKAHIYSAPIASKSKLELLSENETKSTISHSFLNTKHDGNKKSVFVRLKNFRAVPISTSVSINRTLFAPRNSTGFFIVTGCFAQYENAVSYVGKLRKKGFKAQIIDQSNGLFRISVSSLKNRKKALEELDRVKAFGYKNAWVLSK